MVAVLTSSARRRILIPAPPVEDPPLTGLIWRVRADTDVYQATDYTSPVTTDGDIVASWKSFAAGAQAADHLVQNTEGNRPAWKTNRINGHPSVLSDSVDDAMPSVGAVAHGIGTGAFTGVMVVRFTSVGEAYQGVAQNGSFAPAFYSSNNPAKPNFYWAGDHLFATTLSAGTWYYFFVQRRASDNLVRLWVNGSLDANSFTLSNSMGDAVQLILAEGAAGTNNGKCEIAERLIYTTEVDRTEMNAYIDSRYNL